MKKDADQLRDSKTKIFIFDSRAGKDYSRFCDGA